MTPNKPTEQACREDYNVEIIMSYAAFRNLKINILLLMLQSGYYWMFLMDYYMDRLFVFIVVGVSVGLIVAHGNFKFQLQKFFSIFLTNCYNNQYFSWIEIQLVDILMLFRPISFVIGPFQNSDDNLPHCHHSHLHGKFVPQEEPVKMKVQKLVNQFLQLVFYFSKFSFSERCIKFK